MNLHLTEEELRRINTKKGFLALEVSGTDPRKDAVTRDIQPESQNCGWSGV